MLKVLCGTVSKDNKAVWNCRSITRPGFKDFASDLSQSTVDVCAMAHLTHSVNRSNNVLYSSVLFEVKFDFGGGGKLYQ